MSQMKEHFKAPEKIQLSDKEIANLIRCIAQNTDNQEAHRTG